jgi:uncharacterized surface protein with fasciclin (FAS1) repeats
MVSVAPNSQAYDMQHMWNFTYLRTKKPREIFAPSNSVLGKIKHNKDFSIFLKIVEKAGMEAELADPQFNSTIFVPSDKELKKLYDPNFFKMLDRGTARTMIMFSTLKYKIDRNLLTSSPSSYFPTSNRSHRLYIINMNGVTELPNCTRVIKWDINLCNGMIHVINNILYPPFISFT